VRACTHRFLNSTASIGACEHAPYGTETPSMSKSATNIEERPAGATAEKLPTGMTIDPVSPGEVLKAEFLDPLGLSATAFAARLEVPANRITRVISGASRITAETALLLAAALGTTAEFWMTLQAEHDLEAARRDAGVRARVRGVKPVGEGVAA
jgi:addiction module HigA family antidote